MRESTIEDYLVDEVNRVKGIVRKVQWIGRKGAPDRRVMHILGRVWVELKAPGKPLETPQKREHKRMRSRGELVITIDTIEGVDAFIFQLMQGAYAAG